MRALVKEHKLAIQIIEDLDLACLVAHRYLMVDLVEANCRQLTIICSLKLLFYSICFQVYVCHFLAQINARNIGINWNVDHVSDADAILRLSISVFYLRRNRKCLDFFKYLKFLQFPKNN